MIETQLVNQNLKLMMIQMTSFTENISLDQDGRKYSITHKNLEQERHKEKEYLQKLKDKLSTHLLLQNVAGCPFSFYSCFVWKMMQSGKKILHFSAFFVARMAYVLVCFPGIRTWVKITYAGGVKN